MQMSAITRLLRARKCSTLPGARLHSRLYSESPTAKPRSPHSQWYADIVPAMFPIFLLGSAVYLGLQLTQLKISHEKFMEEAEARVRTLESEVEVLQEKRANQPQEMVTSQPVQATNTRKSGWW